VVTLEREFFMERRRGIVFLAIVMALVSVDVSAESLADYVAACESQVGFTAAQWNRPISCNDGLLFAPPRNSQDATNDYVGYIPINSQVDLVFACRWLSNRRVQPADPVAPATGAISIEAIVHNKVTGKTCYVAAKPTSGALGGGPDTQVPVLLPALPAALNLPPPPGSSAASLADAFYMQPADIDSIDLPPGLPSEPGDTQLKCAGCHVSGPYIASPRIAPFLAHFGLLNNGHPTNGPGDLTLPNGQPIYSAVGATFNHWNSDLIAGFNVAGGCASGCHSIANTQIPSPPPPHQLLPFSDIVEGEIVIPSITSDIALIENATFPDANGNPIPAMPADLNPNSPYRWVNMDSPLSPSQGEAQTLSDLHQRYPDFYCPNPTALEAHAIFTGDSANFAGGGFFANPQTGNFDPSVFATQNFDGTGASVNDFKFSTSDALPDRLHTFNLRDGLVCVNSEQENGQQCHDYATRYLCNGEWSQWYNTDSPSGDGDHEERTRDQNLCATPRLIQAHTVVNGATVTFNGPNDRLAQFTPFGLVCNNADQPDGQCSSYVVRFDVNLNNCAAPPAFTARINSVWAAGNQLTASAMPNDSPAKSQPANPGWTSQQWVIQPVPDTGFVRLLNVWTNTYLNDDNLPDKSKVSTFALTPSWLSEQWVIEPIAGSSTDVRIRNVWTGNYLNVVDQSTFSNVLSQVRNTSWLSERWRIQPQ